MVKGDIRCEGRRNSDLVVSHVETIGYEPDISTFVEIAELGSLGWEIGASQARFANGFNFNVEVLHKGIKRIANGF